VLAQLTSQPRACPAPIRVYGFGPLRIESDGNARRAGRKRARRPLQLLGALVALGGERVSQVTLADLLWPDADGDRQAGSLRSTIHRLRSLLGDKEALVTEGQRLSLDSNRVCVDVFAFERQLAEASEYPAESRRALELVARAVDLYGGPFLADEQERWLVPARERLRQAYETAVGRLAAARLAGGDTGAALDLYHHALKRAPDAETLRHGLARVRVAIARSASGPTAPTNDF
jgi:DNA-binding SARP family transcriptional activator